MSETLYMYQDLLSEIELIKHQLKYINREYKNIYNKSLITPPKGVGTTDYSKERVSGGLMQTPAYDALGRMDELMDMYNRLEKELREKEKWAKEMKDYMESFEGVEKQIAYKRIVEGKKLETIAGEVNLSYQHVRRIHMKMQRKGNKKVANS